MRSVSLTLLLAGWSSAAFAQQAGDAARGHTYATMVCSACHSVEIGGTPSPNPSAPVWRDFANTPGMTATALMVFLSTPHQKMPDLVIERRDMQDLIAYILTLRRAPPL